MQERHMIFQDSEQYFYGFNDMSLRSSTNTSMRSWRRYFPLISVDSVVVLFEEMLQNNHSMESFPPSIGLEPNLAFASIILGYIESHITRDPSAPITAEASLSTLSTRKRPSSSNLRSPRAVKLQEDDARSSASMPPSDLASSPMSISMESPKSVFPTLKFEDAEQLYQQFYEMIVQDPKVSALSQNPVDSVTGGSTKRTIPQSSNRDIIRVVCDAICSHLSSSLRIRERIGHAQSIYSLLKSGQLDSFGLAYSTVAACQLLGYSDVHLALSEDHAWVEFGPPERRENADVSVMPGLGFLSSSSGDISSSPATLLRPPPVRLEPFLHSWLYLNGYSVVCNPGVLSIAAVVAAIQPSRLIKSSVESLVGEHFSSRRLKSKMSTLSTSSDGHSTRIVEGISTELLQLKQRLLWTVYRAGLLDRYPLGLTNLAEIEMGFPTPGIQVSDIASDLHLTSPGYSLPEVVEIRGEGIAKEVNFQPDIPLELLRRAVEINRVFFRNQHVYPYLYLANYHRRRDDAIGALHYWVEAARVIGQYNHSTEDVEIYREFLEIATVIIPDFFRPRPGDVSGPNLLENPLCMAYLLVFFDHLCLWEEGSAVPVLHVGWVDKLVASLVRFPPSVRTQLHIEVTRSTNDESSGSAAVTAKKSRCRPSTTATTALLSAQPVNKVDDSKVEMDEVKNEAAHQPLIVILPPPIPSSAGLQSSSTTGSSVLSVFPSGGEISSTLPEVDGARSVPESIISSSFINNEVEEDEDDNPLDVNRLMSEYAAGNTKKVIARLAKASQFRILNPRFLMGVKNESPFTSSDDLNDFFDATESVVSQKNSDSLKNTTKEDVKKGEGENQAVVESVGGHSGHQELGMSTEGEVTGIDIPSLRHLHRISPSPESSVCPSLPSIASTPPLPLQQPPLPVTITTNDDLESERTEAYLQRPISSQVGQTQSRVAEVDVPTGAEPAGAVTDSKSPGVYIRFYSTKMCRIGHLLNTPGPLKTSAIKLTLTAQSEVDIGRRGRCRRSSASTSWNRIPDNGSAPATE
nr:dnaJ subfamily B [Hymenolepis microstoma]